MIQRCVSGGLGVALLVGSISTAGVARAASSETETVFFLDTGTDRWDAVAQVDGRSVVGWAGLRDSDNSFCFRGRMVDGRLVGSSFNRVPETGEWVVDRLAVRGQGSGPRFRVTAIRIWDSRAQKWIWDRTVDRMSRAQAAATLGSSTASLLARFPRRCAALWEANATETRHVAEAVRMVAVDGSGRRGP
jgi:hypothetical protein